MRALAQFTVAAMLTIAGLGNALAQSCPYDFRISATRGLGFIGVYHGTTPELACKRVADQFAAIWDAVGQRPAAQTRNEPQHIVYPEEISNFAACFVSLVTYVDGQPVEQWTGGGRITAGGPAENSYTAFPYGQTPAFCLEVSLEGPSSTKALPAGPALPHIARVTQGGAPAAGRAVTITVMSGAAVSGSTNTAGEFRFQYVPPRKTAVIDQLTATCTDCINTATKQITVEACDICEGTR